MPVDESTETDELDESGAMTDEEAEGSDVAETDDATAALGDAGKKALDAMKARWKTERDARKAAEDKLAAATKPKAPAEGEPPDLDAIRAEAAREATDKANERIKRSEIRAAATGKLANPALALRLLNLEEFEVDADGNVDTQEINDAIAALIEENPGLGVTQGEPKNRFKGGADGGARGEASKSQLTEADVKRLSREGKHDEIEKARLDGRLNKMLGIT